MQEVQGPLTDGARASFNKQNVASEVRDTLLRARADLDQGNPEKARLALGPALNWLESYYGAYADMHFALSLRDIGEQLYKESYYQDALRCLLLAGRIADRFVEPGNRESMKVLYLVEACLEQIPRSSVFLAAGSLVSNPARLREAQAGIKPRHNENREYQSNTFSQIQMEIDRTRQLMAQNEDAPSEAAPQGVIGREARFANDTRDKSLDKIRLAELVLSVIFALALLFGATNLECGPQPGADVRFESLDGADRLEYMPDAGKVRYGVRPAINMTCTTPANVWWCLIGSLFSRPVMAQLDRDALYLEDGSAFYLESAPEAVLAKQIKRLDRDALYKSSVKSLTYKNPFAKNRQETVNVLREKTVGDTELALMQFKAISGKSLSTSGAERSNESQYMPGAIDAYIYKPQLNARFRTASIIRGYDRMGMPLRLGKPGYFLTAQTVDDKSAAPLSRSTNILERQLYRPPRLIIVENSQLAHTALSAKLFATGIFILGLITGVGLLYPAGRRRGFSAVVLNVIGLMLLSFCLFGVIGLFLP